MYTRHVEFLKQHQDANGEPRLYSHYRTFWLPQKCNYFLLRGKSKPRPSQIYNLRFFYWDPGVLSKDGLKCPKCTSVLRRHGFTRPRRVVDLENCFYMIGQWHLCANCRHPKTTASNSATTSVTFNSWDPRIIAQLPPELAAEFPAQLSHRSTISASVFALM